MDPKGNSANIVADCCNVFIAGLPQSASESDLAAAFGAYGTVVSTKVLLDIHSGHSKGVGFVLFENPCEAQLAVASANGQRFMDSKQLLRVKLAAGQSSDFVTPGSTRIYIRNVPSHASQPFVMETLRRFGRVATVVRRDDPRWREVPDEANVQTGKMTILFVDYETTAGAADATTALHGSKLFSSVPLLVKRIEPRDSARVDHAKEVCELDGETRIVGFEKRTLEQQRNPDRPATTFSLVHPTLTPPALSMPQWFSAPTPALSITPTPISMMLSPFAQSTMPYVAVQANPVYAVWPRNAMPVPTAYAPILQQYVPTSVVIPC